MTTPETTREKPLVVVAEHLAAGGMEQLRAAGLDVCDAAGRQPEELRRLLTTAQALIVRSKTKVTSSLLDAAPALRVVGRAGVGVDAIDVEAATRHGIIVLNTPDASTLATAEHTLAMILALSRNIVAANQRVHAGQWDARGLAGGELAGKVLGIVGLGRIGAAVAARARAFQMTVIAHDAVIGEARAESLGVKLVPLDTLLQRADYVTLHVPATPMTRDLIAINQFALMRSSAFLINCARGELVNGADLLEALDTGGIAGAALDVTAVEPPPADADVWRLLQHPKVLVTPHLGGSTRESQERIALDLCRDVIAVLRGAPPAGAVNAPVSASAEVRPFVELAYRMGRAFPQMWRGGGLSHFSVVLEGELAAYDALPFSVAFLSGLLPFLTDRRVSAVNAQALAADLGISVESLSAASERGFSKSLAVRSGEAVLAGTVVHREQLRLIDLDGFEVDIAPHGYLLLTRHLDIPGIVGKVGTILGEARINISNMQVARREQGDAMMLLGIHRLPQPALLERLRTIPDVSRVDVVEL
ncbi:MAG: phosphoglycerate dehydrogenase [Candidatus Eremiobacteraeota bacterium]|nr:phosphoglycerate dehydrogenase [Candidatus Eremiobacteraeota bacterium]